MPFNPKVGDRLTIGGTDYVILPHPNAPTMAYGLDGRKAVVYQVRRNGVLCALKVFKDRFRDPALVPLCQALSQITVRGLEACSRRCLTRQWAGSVLHRFPELEFAVLMSWIDGSTWNDTLIDRTNLSEDHSKRLAKNTADVLANIGTRGYAHCDIASANVIVNLQTSQVTLIDVEDMYGPGLPRPSAPPQGTPGYQHRQSLVATDGQWSSCGDRFSGAVLLSEMLCWHQAEFRAASDESSFYNQNEVQDPSSPRYRLMKDILDKMSSSIGKLFERAWHSQTLDQCPPLSEWARLFEFPVVSEWVPIKPPPPAPPYQPVFSGPIQVPTPQQWKPQFIPLTMPLAQSSKPTEAPLYFRITRTSPGAPFTFEWLPVRDAEGYVIQEADQEDFKRPREVYRGKETHWEKRADPNSNILYYRVAAFNSQGTGPWSLVNSTY